LIPLQGCSPKVQKSREIDKYLRVKKGKLWHKNQGCIYGYFMQLLVAIIGIWGFVIGFDK
jgi:hypothetical protein